MDPGALLREARRRSRLSQYEVADRASCSQSVVARVESGKREPQLAKLERMLAACGFQLHTELEPLDTTLDKRIDDLATGKEISSLYLVSNVLVDLARRLADARVPFTVDGVTAAILYGFPLPHEGVQLRVQDELNVLRGFARTLDLRRDLEPTRSPHYRDIAALPRLDCIYDLRDPDAHWLTDDVQLRVRTQLADPCADAVIMPVRGYLAEITVHVVPLQRLHLPRRYARALERMRHRLADLDQAESMLGLEQ